jgi:endonuclease/exonuclease/phosphatase family metal-dependent hydrolase
MTFRVMTWNVENFAKDDAQGKVHENYQAKLAHVAERINALEPTVVALQEVLDEDALRDLAEKTQRKPLAAPPDRRGNRVAFLVRTEVVATTLLLDYALPSGAVLQGYDRHQNVVVEQRLSRPAFELSVTHGGQRITLINAHLKSKLQTFPDGKFDTSDEGLRAGVGFFDLTRRAAEAVTLRARVTTLLEAGGRVLVVGDLNDGPHAATTEILYGPPGSQPNDAKDATRRNSGFTQHDAGDPQRLFNVTLLVPEVDRWTRVTHHVPELIDHILCSAELVPLREGLRKVPTVKIMNEELISIGARPRRDSGIPDHAPVVATFGS